MKVNWIEIDNIKSFKTTTKVVLNEDHNFVVGTNGSGKTTLLQALSSCLLILVPPNRTQTEAQGTVKKYKFGPPVQNVVLPRNFERDGDGQKITIEVSFESSKDGLIQEIENYLQIFQENKEYLIDNFWNQEGLIENTTNYLNAFKAYSGYTFKFEFYIDIGSNSLGFIGESRQENSGVINILENIETLRLVYNHLFKIGKTKEIVTKGFHIVYLGSDRAVGFPPEIPLNRGNVEEYLNNTAYSRKADLINNIYANGSFDYINQTLTSIAEQYVYRRWQLREDEPLKNIDEYNELKTRIKDLLDLDFDLEVPGTPYEPIKPYFLSSGNKILFEQFSSGEKSLIYFLFTLANSDINNSFIIIDEAEIHLHGNMQDVLLKIIFSRTKLNNQHFISTHSSKLINKLTISSVLRFYKVNQSTQYVNFKSETDERTDYDIIRLINSQNNEKIFFADKVILVEGIKDRILVEAIIDKVNDTKDIVEVIEVGGKLNLAFYKNYLNEIKVPNYTLADFDYLHDICKTELGSLLVTNTKKVDSILKHKKSGDKLSLIESIEEYIRSNDKVGLNKVVEYLKVRGTAIKDPLTKTENKLLIKTIDDLKKSGIYVISTGYLSDKSKYSGEIEDYLLHIQASKNRNDSINNLVKYLSEDKFLSTFIDKSDALVVNEIFMFIADVLYRDGGKANQIITRHKRRSKR